MKTKSTCNNYYRVIFSHYPSATDKAWLLSTPLTISEINMCIEDRHTETLCSLDFGITIYAANKKEGEPCVGLARFFDEFAEAIEEAQRERKIKLIFHPSYAAPQAFCVDSISYGLDNCGKPIDIEIEAKPSVLNAIADFCLIGGQFKDDTGFFGRLEPFEVCNAKAQFFAR